MDFASALGQTAKKKPAAKGKSTVPIIEIPDELKDYVDKYLEAKAVEKKAKAEMDHYGGELVSYTQKHQDDRGYKGDFRTSYGLEGNSGNVVKYVSSNRYSINSDDEAQIRRLLGTRFEELIEKKPTVQLRPEVFENEAMQQKLMGLIGEHFAEFFETTIKMSAKEGFDRQIYNVVGPDDLPALRTFCRPYKPSLR